MTSGAGFASIERVAAVERAEVALLADMIAAGASRCRGGFCERFAGGCAGYLEPGSPVNKVAGLGFDGVPDADTMARVERAFAERSAPPVVEIATHADPAVFAMLGERGYRLAGFEDVVAIEPTRARRAERAAGVEVVCAPSGADLAAWRSCVIEGFAAPDTQGIASHEQFPRAVVDGAMRDMAQVDGFTAWSVHVDGEPVAAGGMRLHGGVAHLCGAATLPAFRRRGLQSALITARLAHAAELGCELVVAVTQPGSKSQQNMHAAGFWRLHSRAVMMPAAASAQASRSA